jgi:hypothetical protein
MKSGGKTRGQKLTLMYTAKLISARVYSSAYILAQLNPGATRRKFISIPPICSVISAPYGIKKLQDSFPKMKIITAAIDDRLNGKNYIVPGLGDAGDRVFNTIY